jgi:hypothetical protein
MNFTRFIYFFDCRLAHYRLRKSRTQMQIYIYSVGVGACLFLDLRSGMCCGGGVSCIIGGIDFFLSDVRCVCALHR